MNRYLIAVAAAIVAVVMIAPIVSADQYYLIRDQYGNLAVTNGEPLYGWYTQWGPYSTVDQAQRAAGISNDVSINGSSGVLGSYSNFYSPPQVVPKKPGVCMANDLTC